jgi:hypothetical protein
MAASDFQKIMLIVHFNRKGETILTIGAQQVSCRLVGKRHVQEVASFFQAILETNFKTTRRTKNEKTVIPLALCC